MVQEVELGNAKGQKIYTLIDSDDSEMVNKYRWHLVGKYAGKRHYMGNGMYKTLYLHKYIMGERDGLQVDHINLNKLDNRRSNLRFCTEDENRVNRPPNKGRKYKGVYWNKRRKKWSVEVNYHGTRHWLGYHDDERIAAIIYNIKASELHGSFVRLNNV